MLEQTVLEQISCMFEFYSSKCHGRFERERESLSNTIMFTQTAEQVASLCFHATSCAESRPHPAQQEIATGMSDNSVCANVFHFFWFLLLHCLRMNRDQTCSLSINKQSDFPSFSVFLALIRGWPFDCTVCYEGLFGREMSVFSVMIIIS